MKVISKPAAVIVAGVVIVISMLVPLVNAQPATSTPMIPPIEFNNCPLDVAIQALAREADINYLIDPRVIRWWERSLADGGADQTPIENFRVTNMTPEEVLERILTEHHLVLLKDPQTGVARVTYPNQTVKIINSDIYAFAVKSHHPGYEGKLPIQFNDVPVSIALEALAHEANINFALSPRIGYGNIDKDGNVQIEPTLTCNWNNVTPAQGFFAACENYNLIVSKDPQTGILIVSTNSELITNYVDASLLGSDTNEFIPIQAMGNLVLRGADCSNTNDIELEDQPLVTALKQLATSAQINMLFDAGLSDAPTVCICLNKISAKKAIVVLCDIYGLAITKNPMTGDIEIGPQDSRSSGVPLVPTLGKG